MAAVSVKRSIASTQCAGYFGEDELYDLSHDSLRSFSFVLYYEAWDEGGLFLDLYYFRAYILNLIKLMDISF